MNRVVVCVNAEGSKLRILVTIDAGPVPITLVVCLVAAPDEEPRLWAQELKMMARRRARRRR